MSTVRGPKIGPTLTQIHDALVSGFDNFKLSDGKFLNASNTVTKSISGGMFPFLAFMSGSFTMSPWKDFEQSVSWDIPATLYVQGPGEDGEQTVRRTLMDVIFRTQEIVGLPIDDRGRTVPFGDETLQLFDQGKLTFLCERGAPYIKSVRIDSIDDGLSTASIVFHVETTMLLDPRTLRLMKVGVLGITPVAPNSLYQDTTAEDGRGISIVFAETGQGGYNTPDPSVPPGFYSSAQEQPNTNQAAGVPLAQSTASVNVTPYTASLSVGAPTQQLSAIAFALDASSSYVTSTAAWFSTNAAVATVSASGLVTRVSAGSCSVSCTYNGVTSNSVAVTCT